VIDVPEQPAEGWLGIIRYLDDVRAENRMSSEAIHALQERLDDWDRDQEIKRMLFEQRLLAQIQFTGKNAEDAQRQVESVNAQLQAHMGSHKLKDKEHLDRVESLQAERIKARTALWIQILVIVGAFLVAALNLIPHFLK